MQKSQIFFHESTWQLFRVSNLTMGHCIQEVVLISLKKILLQISAYIEAKQLKTAYFLAVKYKRTSDIKRIMKEAEVLNQPNIKILCQKILQSHQHPQKSHK